ncbi:hypothetical protein CTI12_AA298300 [Artemisia annua]|uniref:Uncharacterized protein n=1 Tax=Artemisia annua TaxID=35608 RepID=A0A2U1N7B3_ARTAN|nr:hypothetical protein CTI12_AA298300 [Artemisia annua]
METIQGVREKEKGGRGSGFDRGSTSVGREGRPHQPEGVVSSLESEIFEQISQSGYESNSQQPGHDVRSATPLDENVMSEGNNGSSLRVPSQTEEVNVRKSSRPSKLPVRFNDFVLNTSIKYGLNKFMTLWVKNVSPVKPINDIVDGLRLFLTCSGSLLKQ